MAKMFKKNPKKTFVFIPGFGLIKDNNTVVEGDHYERFAPELLIELPLEQYPPQPKYEILEELPENKGVTIIDLMSEPTLEPLLTEPVKEQDLTEKNKVPPDLKAKLKKKLKKE